MAIEMPESVVSIARWIGETPASLWKKLLPVIKTKENAETFDIFAASTLSWTVGQRMTRHDAGLHALRIGISQILFEGTVEEMENLCEYLQSRSRQQAGNDLPNEGAFLSAAFCR